MVRVRYTVLWGGPHLFDGLNVTCEFPEMNVCDDRLDEFGSSSHGQDTRINNGNMCCWVRKEYTEVCEE